MTKVCTKCRVEKPLEAFSSTSPYKGGARYRSDCKECNAKSRWERRNLGKPYISREDATIQARQLIVGDGSGRLCVECQLRKEPGDFRNVSSAFDGLDYWCKACRSIWEKNWRKENLEAAQAINQRNYQNHREARKLAAKKYAEDNSEQVAATRRIYDRGRYQGDLNYRLKHKIREKIRVSALKDGGRKGGATESILGCSIEEFRAIIANQFVEGMSWENYGETWELGHKKPVASFDLRELDQQKECWHFSNLFPHFSEQNRSDGAKYMGVDFKGLRPIDFEIEEIDLKRAKGLLEEYHYSHSAPSAATLCFGLFSGDEKVLIGAAVFRPAALGSAKKLAPDDPQSVLCLSRFILVPGTPYNTASYFLSSCTRQIKKSKAFKILVTFADTWQEHDGGIYKASNWKFEGMTIPQPVWTLEGKLIGKRQGRAALTVQDLKKQGAIFHGKFSKSIFTYSLQ